MESSRQNPRWVFAAALLAVALLTGAWFAFNALMKVPPDPKVTSVALSRAGRWLAAGTSQGRIAVWDQTANAAPRQITFDEGPLNDLQFNPEETRLAVASHNLATFDLSQPGVPHFLKQDQRHYGTVRYSQDGASVLVITGSSAIELLDAQSGAPRFSVCCSTIYGEVAFTPDGRRRRQCRPLAPVVERAQRADGGATAAHSANPSVPLDRIR